MTRKLWLASVAALTVAAPALSGPAPGEVVFVDGAVEHSLTGVAGDPQAGFKVMTTAALGNCVACHELTAQPAIQFPGDIGPPLDGAADRWTEAELRGIVTNVKMTFEGSFMPAFYKSEGFVRPGDAYSGKAGTEPLPPILTGQQVEDVVAFLLTLKE